MAAISQGCVSLAFSLFITLLHMSLLSTVSNIFVLAENKLTVTGSFANCTSSPQNQSKRNKENHIDSSFTTISCEEIHYRMPKKSGLHSAEIIIGVLSGASGDGPARRKSIRSTWGYRKEYILFIVAGPWDDIAEEYQHNGDLFWIDKEEIYITETSVLTLKTESFISVMYELFIQNHQSRSVPAYVFKTDDDSYVNLKYLHKVLLEETSKEISSMDYWGKCNDGGWKPHRNHEVEWQKKWYISYEIYPESEYPPYCQGAGFALSRKFLDCAFGQGHAAQIRYMPNEDVAIGLLAERCGIKATNDDRIWIRWKGRQLTMRNKIVQHYVKNENVMRMHHLSATGLRGPILLD